MATEPKPNPDTTASWLYPIFKQYSNSPSAASTNSVLSSTSSSTSSVVSSIDAPSSQSSVSSAAVGWPAWLHASEAPRCKQPSSQTGDGNKHTLKENTRPPGGCNLQQLQGCTRLVAAEARQHPRRTQRLKSLGSQDGKSGAQCSRPPPTLVRQSERKINFVDSLVGERI